MKKQFSFLLLAIFFGMVQVFAVDWSTIDFLGDGAGGGSYANKYKISGVSFVNIQRPGFATADGIYVTFTSADYTSNITIGETKASYDTQGTGVILHLTNFTAKETELKTNGLTFYVYYADGTDGGGGGDTPTASTYCNEAMTESGHTIHLTNTMNGDKYRFIITSEDEMTGINTGSYCYINGSTTQNCQMKTAAQLLDNGHTITIDITSTAAPKLYTNLEVNFKTGTTLAQYSDPKGKTLVFGTCAPAAFEPEYCGWYNAGTTQNGHTVTLTFNTTQEGDIAIVLGDNTSSNARYRDLYFEGGVDNFKVVSTAKGTEGRNVYFDSIKTDANTYTLRLREGCVLPEGAHITLNNIALAWKEGNVGYYSYPVIDYTYGQTCDATLFPPQNLAVASNGTITFDAVEGADRYTAYIYSSNQLMKTQVVSSGDVLDFKSKIAADYTVKLVASNTSTNAHSDWSAYVIWTSSADPTGEMPNSIICEKKFTADNNPNFAANMTWETDPSTGVLTITVTPALTDVSDEDVYFMETAMASDKFTYNGGSMTEYFTKGWQDNVNQSSITWIPRTDAGHIPQYGAKISFTDGKVVYRYSKDGYKWPNLTYTNYIYGTTCSEQLPMPAITNIAADNTITFTTVDYAQSYTLQISLGSNVLYTQANIQTGGKINFYPSNTDTYKAVIQVFVDDVVVAASQVYNWSWTKLPAPTNVAITDAGVVTFTNEARANQYKAYVYKGEELVHQQTITSGATLSYAPYFAKVYSVKLQSLNTETSESSDLTESVTWNWGGNPQGDIPNSDYCDRLMEPTGNNAGPIRFTWETNADGDVVIMVTPAEGDAQAHFRGAAMSLDNFKVNGAAASTYFNKQHVENSNSYTLELKDSSNKPSAGSMITFTNSQVEYWTTSHTNAYPLMTFEYTYGTECTMKKVSATVNDGTMGSAMVKVNNESVTKIEKGTTVTFNAVASQGYEFVNWTKGGVEVSTSATYEVEVNDHMPLVANFDVIRNVYCRTEVLANDNSTLYLSVYKVGDLYTFRVDGSASAPINSRANFNFIINGVSEQSEWTISNEGFGYAYFTFKSVNYLNISFGAAHHLNFGKQGGGEIILDNNMPAASAIKWNAPACVDSEAPVLANPTAEVLSATSVRLTLSATDNWNSPITYAITYGAENAQANGASGAAITKDITGLTANTEYTFYVTASDGTNISAAKSVTITPTGDVQAPTNVSVDARPASPSEIDLYLYADDDYAGDITYTITSTPTLTIDPVIAPQGTTAKTTITGLTANTEYSFSVVATDAANNSADAVNDGATTYNTTNLALNQPATAGFLNQDAHLSNDGNTGSRWGSNGAVHYKTDPVNYQDWWYVDLGAVYNIGSIRAMWENARPQDYTFRTSMDGQTWTTIATYSQMPAVGTFVNYTDLAATAQGRYVGVWATSGYENMSYGISPWEIEVYGSAAVDDVAPIISSIEASGASATSVLVRATATDNFCGDLTYTFYCGDVAGTPVVKASGTEATYQFTDLSSQEYTFYVVVSDGTNQTTSSSVKASPVIDNEAPTGLAVANIVPYYNRVTFSLSAVDDMGGMITYVVKDGDTQITTADAVSGNAANIEVTGLDYLTNYAWTATAQDASGNESDPINIQFTTVAPPFPIVAAPTPKAYPSSVVRAIYSNHFPNILAHDFKKDTWVNIAMEERTIASDQYMLYTVTSQTHATAWGLNDGSENAIVASSGYNDGAHTGVDVREMNKLHVDFWSQVACPNVEVRVCDALVATVQLDGTGWNTFDIDISTLSNDVKTSVGWIKFDRFTETNTFAIDNVFFYQNYDITLDQAEDNSETLTTYDGKYTNVTLNRSFIADGYWYTLCLPFSLTAEQLAAAYGADYDLRYLASSYMKSEDMMYLNFEKATELQAGMPYMFKPTGTSNENYGAKTFTGVVIDNKTPENETEVATMTGYYSPMVIANTDYALGSDDYLYHTDGTISNAFRCYFTLNPPTSAPVRARCVFNDSHVVTNLDSNRFTDSPVDQFTKFIYNGELIIIRDGRTYNAQGVRL